MEDIKLIIAKNIIELRKRDGITQAELAEKLSYTDKAVSKWERGASVPDIAVLKDIADLFGVTIDYLVTEEHEAAPQKPAETNISKLRNHGFITGMSILLVWLVATIAFVIIDSVNKEINLHWLAFLYAVPVSMIVWLVMNSIWFNARRNFAIISCLMWSVLIALHITLLAAVGLNLWLVYILGIPGQAIIFMWSRLKFKS